MTRMKVNGEEVAFEPGETILDVTRRQGLDVPTLCHDPRLEPTGACRACLVDVDGSRRLIPACATLARPEMAVQTESERVAKHRETLFALYMTDHPHDRVKGETGAPNQIYQYVDQYQAPTDWGYMEARRKSYEGDRNPYIQFNAETCIACARCTRYCDEIEGVTAISLTNRGSATTISTSDHVSLLDSTCEMCGGCVAVCPTGAMTEKMPLTRGAKPEAQLTKVRSTCNFCGVGCQVDLNVDQAANDGAGQLVKVTSPPPGTTTNDGNLCVKGRFAYDFIHHDERLQTPLVRGEDGELHPASWDEALEVAAKGLLGVKERHGADSLAFVSSSRCTMEENFLVQKMSRAVFGTNNVHQCAAT